MRRRANDGPVTTYNAGQSFSEPPGDRRGVSANASETKPAKLLAVFVLDTNETELTTLYQTADFDTAIAVLHKDIDTAVITRSEKGCLVLGPDGTEAVSAFPVDRVVDTTGAGDLFAAGFLFGLVRGVGHENAGRLGALARLGAAGRAGRTGPDRRRPPPAGRHDARGAGLL